MNHRAFASLVASLLLLAVVPAAADDTPKPAPKPTKPATAKSIAGSDDPYAGLAQPKTSEPSWVVEKRREELFNEGKKLIQEERWQEAIEKLREVNKIRFHPEVLLWMGYPEERLGHLVEARKIYTQAKEDAEKLKLKQEQRNAEAALAALAPQISHLLIHLPQAPGAVVAVDAVGVTLEGEQADVNPGKHQVFVAWPNRLPFQKEVAVNLGQTETVDVALSPLPQPPPPCPPPPLPPRQGACGCRVGAASEPLGGTAMFVALGLGAALAAYRRRARGR